jgi:hypothetical protein
MSRLDKPRGGCLLSVSGDHQDDDATTPAIEQNSPLNQLIEVDCMYRIDCTTQAIVRVRTRRQHQILNPMRSLPTI